MASTNGCYVSPYTIYLIISTLLHQENRKEQIIHKVTRDQIDVKRGTTTVIGIHAKLGKRG